MSFWRLYYHLVWGTKNREPIITDSIEQLLFAYLSNKASTIETYVHAINGWYDHIHLVVTIPPKIAVAEVIKILKGGSSYHLNKMLDSNFAWQRGYGALSVGERNLNLAIDYVNNQKEHHARRSTNKWLEMVNDLKESRINEHEQDTTTLNEMSTVYLVDYDPPW